MTQEVVKRTLYHLVVGGEVSVEELEECLASIKRGEATEAQCGALAASGKDASHWREEGATSSEDFMRIWREIHPKRFEGHLAVWMHRFLESGGSDYEV